MKPIDDDPLLARLRRLDGAEPPAALRARVLRIAPVALPVGSLLAAAACFLIAASVDGFLIAPRLERMFPTPTVPPIVPAEYESPATRLAAIVPSVKARPPLSLFASSRGFR